MCSMCVMHIVRQYSIIFECMPVVYRKANYVPIENNLYQVINRDGLKYPGA